MANSDMAKKRAKAASTHSSGKRRTTAKRPKDSPFPGPEVIPRWDKESGELWLGEVLLHHFRRVPTTIGLILSVFEELGWPPSIDDPLTPIIGRWEPDRLRSQINTFNRRMLNPLIQLRMDGSGEGIRWERAL